MKTFPALLIAAAFAAGMTTASGAAAAWVLSRVVPWTGGYGRAALWGLLELGFVGLTFVASIRNVVGIAVFLATLPLGALWGLAVLAAFRGAGAAAGPYRFSIAFSVSVMALVYGTLLILAAWTRRREPGTPAG